MDTLPPRASNGNIPVASGVYKITCTANKRIYIGSTVNLYQRKAMHFSALRHNRHINPIMQNAWNKYGPDAFTFEVLELVLPMSLAAREQYWFAKLSPFGKRGFNIAPDAGSCLGRKHTLKTRELMRENHHPDETHTLEQIDGVIYRIQAQYRKCGKASCSHCRDGALGHGPYKYAYWRDETGHLHSKYMGKVSQVTQE